MDTVKVSPKFQVVIPLGVRKELNIRPGERLTVIEKEGTIHLIPIGKISSMRGFVAGTSMKGLRDEKERFD